MPLCQIVDIESGATLGANQDGEVWIKGPQTSSGFLNLPVQTKEMFAEDGWIRTGQYHKALPFEPRHKKTCIRDLRPDETQTDLLSYRSQLEA